LNLSDQDKALLDQLVKAERDWYRYRYWLIACGVLLVLVTFGGVLLLLTKSEEAALRWMHHPGFYVGGIFAGACFGMAVRAWKGNVAHRLLISIAKELTRNEQHKA